MMGDIALMLLSLAIVTIKAKIIIKKRYGAGPVRSRAGPPRMETGLWNQQNGTSDRAVTPTVRR